MPQQGWILLGVHGCSHLAFRPMASSPVLYTLGLCSSSCRPLPADPSYSPLLYQRPGHPSPRARPRVPGLPGRCRLCACLRPRRLPAPHRGRLHGTRRHKGGRQETQAERASMIHGSCSLGNPNPGLGEPSDQSGPPIPTGVDSGTPYPGQFWGIDARPGL
jgi:hypothetical protein